MFKGEKSREDVSELTKEETHAADVSLIKKLLTYELSDTEHVAFGTMQGLLQRSSRTVLTEKQRDWGQGVLDRFEPQYENAFSAGKVPRGKEVVVNVGPRPLRPPTRSST